MRIIEVVGLEKRGEFGLVHVVLEDGTEGAVYVGGDVEVYFHKGQIKVFVKRPSDAKKVLDA